MIASTVSIYFAVTKSMATGTEQVKETIEGTVVTYLEEDSNGHPIVKDTNTGLVTSSRTVGDSFRTLVRYDPVSGQQVPCIDIGSGKHTSYDMQLWISKHYV